MSNPPSRCPYGAEWHAIEPSGQIIVRSLSPEDILQDIADGLTPEQITEKHEALLEAVEHVICEIPRMMAWRRKVFKVSKVSAESLRLPVIEGSDPNIENDIESVLVDDPMRG